VSDAMLNIGTVITTVIYKVVPIFFTCWLIKINEREQEKNRFVYFNNICNKYVWFLLLIKG